MFKRLEGKTFAKKFNQTERNAFRAEVMEIFKETLQNQGIEVFEMQGKLGFHVSVESINNKTECGGVPMTLELKLGRDWQEKDLEEEQADYLMKVKAKEEEKAKKDAEKKAKIERDKAARAEAKRLKEEMA